MNYIFASGAIGVKTTELFKENEYLTLQKADKGDYFKTLRDLGYGFDHVAYYLDDVITNELIKVKSQLLQVVPSPNIIRLWFLKYDLINIKLIIKNHYFLQNQDIKFDQAATISIDELKEALINNNFDKVSDINTKLLRSINEQVNNKMTSQQVSLLVDKIVYNYILDEAIKLGEAPFMTYFKEYIDSRNLLTMYRAEKINLNQNLLKEALIDGGYVSIDTLLSIYQKLPLEQVEVLKLHYSKKVLEVIQSLNEHKDLSLLEKVSSEEILEKLVNYGYDTFSSGPVVNYLVKKEFEINNVRRLYFDKDIDLSKLLKY